MRSYQNYSESDLRLFKTTATKMNTFIDLTRRRQQFDRKQLVVNNDRYKKTDTINNQQPADKVERSISLTRINFIYHQPISSKSIPFSLDKYTQWDKLQQKLVQNKKDKFMKVISKNYIPKDVLKFVYGKQSPQSINQPHSIETHRSSFNTKIGQQQSHYRVSSSNRDKIVYDRIGVKNGLMSNGQGFEYFPLSKVKRSRNNSSSRKSSQSELQLLDNCKSQLVKQQYKTLMLMQNKNDKNGQQLMETQVLNRTQKQRQDNGLNKADEQINDNNNNNDNKNNINSNNDDNDDKLTQQQQSKDQINQYHHNDQTEQINHFNNNSHQQREQEWNNTIKFNHINLNLHHSNIYTNINSKALGSNINSNKLSKLQQTNHSSNFNNTNFNKSSQFNNSTAINTYTNNTNNTNNESPFTQQDDYKIKNHIQKISEFILCDQQIGKEQNPFKSNTKCHQFSNQNKDLSQGNLKSINQNDLNNSPTQNDVNQNKNKVYSNNYLFQQYTLSGQHNKRSIPVFQIKLSDLQKEKDLQLTKDLLKEKQKDLQTEKEKDIQFQNIQTFNQDNQNPNEQSIKEQQKILHNIQTSDTLAGLRQSQNNNRHIQQNFHIYDRLQSSIQQLGKNIGDLSGKIEVINAVKNDQSNVSVITSIKNKQKRLGLSSNCYSQKVVTAINNNYDNNKKQRDNQINKSFINDNNDDNLNQKSNKKETRIVDDYVGQDHNDKDIKNFNIVQNNDDQLQQQHNNDSHLIDGQSQNEFLNYSYSRQLKHHEHFEFNDQQGQPSQIKTIHQNHVLGSLEIIDHQTSLMGQSLHNIYANSQSQFINGQKQRYGQKHDMNEEDSILKQQYSNIRPQQQQNQRRVHFEEYDQNKFNQQQLDNIPQQRQQKSLTQNFFNKLQRQRRIRQFYGVKTFQKTRSKSQIQKYNKNQLNKFNDYNGSNNFQNKTYNNKNYQRQSKLFQSKGLNYQMYKTYRDKSLSKRYSLLGVDHKKQRLIQLPYMDRPFDMKLNGESIKLPKYIKSKVYYVKG